MKRLLGGLLSGVGLLISAVSGVCALIFMGEAFSDANMAQAVLTLGGIPFLIGVGMIFGGVKLLRSAREQEPPTSSGDGPQTF
jgi:hypothetical protein